MIVHNLVYVSVLPGAVLLRKQEVILTIFFGVCLAILIANDPNRLLLAAIIGLLLPLAEYVCIRYDMWEYNKNHRTFKVPLWLWFGWAIVALFIVDVNQRLHAS